jgi:hypothetical protein
MRKWDLLLEWMTHLGSGAWEAFRGAVAELADDDVDDQRLVRTLRITLSDLGHVESISSWEDVHDRSLSGSATRLLRALPSIWARASRGCPACTWWGTPRQLLKRLQASGLNTLPMLPPPSPDGCCPSEPC